MNWEIVVSLGYTFMVVAGIGYILYVNYKILRTFMQTQCFIVRMLQEMPGGKEAWDKLTKEDDDESKDD